MEIFTPGHITKVVGLQADVHLESISKISLRHKDVIIINPRLKMGKTKSTHLLIVLVVAARALLVVTCEEVAWE